MVFKIAIYKCAAAAVVARRRFPGRAGGSGAVSLRSLQGSAAL